MSTQAASIEYSDLATEQQKADFNRKLNEFLELQSYAMAAFQKATDWLLEKDAQNFGKFFDGKQWSHLKDDLQDALSKYAKSAGELVGHPAVKSLGTMAEDRIDPSGIGRKVPIRFTGDVPPITVNQSFFNQLTYFMMA